MKPLDKYLADRLFLKKSMPYLSIEVVSEFIIIA